MKTDIRICVLANQLLTPNLASGGDVLAAEVLNRFRHHLTVIAPKQSHQSLDLFIPNADYISSDESNTHPQPNLIGGALIFAIYLLRTGKTFLYFLGRHDFDALYLTGDFFCNSVPAVIYKIIHPKIKIFCNFYHLNPTPWNRENNFVFSFASWFMQRFSLFLLKYFGDIFFVLSNEGMDKLNKRGVEASKIVISGAGVSGDFYRIKAEKDYSHSDILFVGRLNKTKGIYDALRCLILIKKIDRTVKLGVIGASTNTELAKIKDIITKNKLTHNFHYFGYVSSEEKIKLMKSTPILIAPSHEEGFGIGVLEGVASGMKVAAYDLPVYRLIFDQYRDRIHYSPIGNVKSLSNNLVNLLREDGINRPVKVSSWVDVSKIQEDVIVRNLIK